MIFTSDTKSYFQRVASLCSCYSSINKCPKSTLATSTFHEASELDCRRVLSRIFVVNNYGGVDHCSARNNRKRRVT